MTLAPAVEERARRVVCVRGIVQGVGFRPFVLGVAERLGVSGFVCNRADGVTIEVEGEAPRIDAFLEELHARCPELARIDELHVTETAPRGETSFVIEQSDVATSAEDRFFAPDVATCDACLAELFDPNDRRYRYPFVNCCQCGPRLTIVRDAPYDRERTTMAAFAMCSDCAREYHDRRDRRHHAQPIACPACGPRLVARDARGEPLAEDPLTVFDDVVASAGVVAVKGIGGYHLACDASSETATLRLRERKHREEKPFAVMVEDVEAARRLCHVSSTEAALLASARRPIVLLRRRDDAPIARAVAPNNPLLGVMLAYSPLHHLLVRRAQRPVVMTSGNRSDEPIAFDDADAIARLQGVADAFLTHDRPIHVRCDDSIVRELLGAPSVLRRSRGFAPEPLRLPMRAERRILAVGGHLKNTFALARGDRAFLSHHVGDLGDWSAYRSFREAIAHYQALFSFAPEVVAHDLHPAYASTEWALGLDGVERVAVQHHHAHMASCMAEHGLLGPAIGVTFDGIGYGLDGSLWGGEFLVGDYRSVRRAAHLRPVALPGGERAIREPWRMAVAYSIDSGLDPARCAPRRSLSIVRRMIETGLATPRTSSAGRLFDAVAALLGLRSETSFEGQAAMELEWLAETSDATGGLPFDLATDDRTGALVVDTRPLIRAVATASFAPATLARRFHETMAEIVEVVASRLRDATGIGDVVLTGGVFQNALLLAQTKRRLEARGLRVHTHRQVPVNDGGLSFGQLAVVAARGGVV